ncbi:hypothetical protein [Burkholderia vietnamiensis]|uniref:hypothetical protein n=1 Tax=Burkholderia vietnamiensis TaxID=60552 RepID=UPI001592ECF8|nr:hypothetical protein [Burkholderia vietnamiensis]
MSKELIEQLKENIEKINGDFPFEDLKGKAGKAKRERVGVDNFDRGVVNFLFNNCDCVQKIFYSTGANAYYYYAPAGFVQYIKNIKQIAEYEKFQVKLAAKDSISKVVKI